MRPPTYHSKQKIRLVEPGDSVDLQAEVRSGTDDTLFDIADIASSLDSLFLLTLVDNSRRVGGEIKIGEVNNVRSDFLAFDSELRSVKNMESASL